MEHFLVLNEGAELYCEKRGSGPLLILMPGGLGDGGTYADAADILADEFTVIIYDQRCHSRSTGDALAEPSVSQMARDVQAIVKSQGASKALLFGNSGGGVIGLEIAAHIPEIVEFLVVHEAPVIQVLPNAGEVTEQLIAINEISKEQGAFPALGAFLNTLVGCPPLELPGELGQRVMGNMDYFFTKLMLPFSAFYRADLGQVRANHVPMVTAGGKESGDAYYVQTVRILAQQLGVEYVEFPGHHNVAISSPAEFAAALRGIFHGHAPMGALPGEVEFYRQAYSEPETRVERGFYWDTKPSALVKQLFASYPGAKNSVLDLACGDGPHLGWLAEQGFKEIWGVDFNQEALSVAAARLSSARLVAADLTVPGSLNEVGQVDLVVLHSIADHIRPIHRPVFLRNIQAALKPGGCVLMVEFAPGLPGVEPGAASKEVNGHYSCVFTMNELESLFPGYQLLAQTSGPISDLHQETVMNGVLLRKP